MLRIKGMKVQHSARSDNLEPKAFKRKLESPALHELLQNPSTLDLGRRIPSNTLHPIMVIGGDFSSVAVMLCLECGHVPRGLGKGTPHRMLGMRLPMHQTRPRMEDGGWCLKCCQQHGFKGGPVGRMLQDCVRGPGV